MDNGIFAKFKSLAIARKKIENWLNIFQNKENMYGGCIVIGGLGIGKTHMVRNILREMDVREIYLTPSLMPAKNKVSRFIHDHIQSFNLEDLFLGIKRRKVLVIDEIENMTFKQKVCLLKFLSWIYPSKKRGRRCSSIENDIPIIFVGRHTHIKALQTVLKHCLQINVESPTLNEQFKMVKQYCLYHNIVSHKVSIEELIHFCHNDVRHLYLMCEEFRNWNCPRLSPTSLRQFLHQYGRVDPQVGVLWSTLDIINGSVQFNDAYRIYQQDKYLLPLMIHENYPLVVNRPEKNIVLNSVCKILNLLLTFDQYDTHMYRHQFWSLQELCGILVCGGISGVLQTEFNSALQDSQNIDSMRFTRHLNRTSMVTVRSKKIKEVVDQTQIYSLDTMYYLKHVMFPSGKAKHINPFWKNVFQLSDKQCSTLFKIDIIPSAKNKKSK